MRGTRDVPVPLSGDIVISDVLLAPMVGFDDPGYRLVSRIGHFDRTITAMSREPLAIGIRHELPRLATIFPQSHGIPIDVISTEQGIFESAQPMRQRTEDFRADRSRAQPSGYLI